MSTRQFITSSGIHAQRCSREQTRYRDGSVSDMQASTTQHGTSCVVRAPLMICARLLQRPFAIAERHSRGACSFHCDHVSTPVLSPARLSPHAPQGSDAQLGGGRPPRSSGSRLSWTPSETSRSMSPSQHRAMCRRKLRRSVVGKALGRHTGDATKGEWGRMQSNMW